MDPSSSNVIRLRTTGKVRILEVPGIPILPVAGQEMPDYIKNRLSKMHFLVDKPPLWWIIVAPPERGKSTFLGNILLQPKMFRGIFDAIHIISPTVEKDEIWKKVENPTGTRWDSFNDECKQFFSNLIRLQGEKVMRYIKGEDDPPPFILIVIDDPMGQGLSMPNGSSIFDQLASKYRWHFISVIFSTQYIMSLSPHIRSYATCWTFFRITEGGEMLKAVKAVSGNLSYPKMRALFDRAWRRDRGFLHVSTRSPIELMYRDKFDAVIGPDTPDQPVSDPINLFE